MVAKKAVGFSQAPKKEWVGSRFLFSREEAGIMKNRWKLPDKRG